MLDLRIGDTVAVIRAGEIIPCILHKVDAWAVKIYTCHSTPKPV
jgi:NAD-dependent DNA ligase